MNDEETQRMADLTRKLADTAIDYKQRAEMLEELVMDIVADCRDGALGYEIEQRIAKVMQKLDEEQPDD
jgi:hypothetical protein